MSVIQDAFKDIIKYHRKKSKLTQAELAKLAGVGKTLIFDIESGKETVRFSSLSRVLEALNISLDWESPLKNVYQRKPESN